MINLLPPTYKEDISYGRKNARTISWAITVAFGIIVLLVVALVGKLTIQTATNQMLSQRESIKTEISLAKLDSTEKQYKTFIDGMSSVKKVYQQQILYSRLIQKLATLLPPEAKLASISLTDKDRAITLNFTNSVDGLGPTIQINLENQGDYIAGLTRQVLGTAFGVTLGGKKITLKDGSTGADINVEAKLKKLTYFVNINEGVDGDKQLSSLKNALSNGGEFAYTLTKDSINTHGYTDAKSAISVPHFESYSVDTQNKKVDFKFSANNLQEMQAVKAVIDSNPYNAFIETYIFDDTDYLYAKKCLTSTDAKQTRTATCEANCQDNSSACEFENKICIPLTSKGCHYILRGYYDELYTTASISDATSQEKLSCKELGSIPCTHKITTTYSQLFEKVDINKVSTCQADATSSITNCPVEMRAEFGANAKFYLINPDGASL